MRASVGKASPKKEPFVNCLISNGLNGIVVDAFAKLTREERER